ncbi:MAG: redox-regulated ATPase YchF, partial [Bacteroidia bacterium]|nr:redox-regulated ATPase YchF [Bacteroidia bacterium]
LKDLESVEKKIRTVEKLAKAGVDKDAKKCFDTLMIYKNHLSDGKSARSAPVKEEDKQYIADIHLLTAKPVLYVCNVDEASVKGGNKYVDQIKELVKDENAEVIVITAAMEAEIAGLDSYEDKQAFLKDIGLTEPGVNVLIKAAYRLLNLQTYFTAGVKEVRAWTIHKGMTAPQAAGVIHSDFEKGFIKAEVIKYNDFITYKSESACRDIGKLSQEGKEYVVGDGDVMHFKFNV